MKTTIQWLDQAKTTHTLSDYALAPKLGITRSQMSRYRNGADFLSDDAALKLAELLGLENPMEVIASAHAERSKSVQARAIWDQLASYMASVSLTPKSRVKKLAGAHPASAGSYAKDSNSPAKDLYIVSSRTAKKAASWLAILSPKPPTFA